MQTTIIPDKGTPRASATSAPRQVGRPSKLTDDVEKTIFEGIELGLSVTKAARRAGVSPQAVSDWRAEFPEFSDGIEGARAKGLFRRIQAIDAATGADGKLDWKAQHALLKLLYPEEFGSADGGKGTVINNTTNVSVALDDTKLAKLQEQRKAALERMKTGAGSN